MSNRRRLLFGGDNIPGKGEAKAGDILCAKEDGSKRIINVSWSSPTNPSYSIPSGWTPIGVVVIPPSHDVYGTGEGAACALLDHETNSQFGSISYTTEQITFDVNNDEHIYPYVNTIGQIGSSLSTTVTPILVTQFNFPTLYTSGYTQIRCPHDDFLGYSTELEGNYAVPSPYIVSGDSGNTCNTSGSRNELYYKTYDGKKNIFSDFRGFENTYSGGRAETLLYKFNTTGTTSGDWYVPAAGEMGYLAARFQLIFTMLRLIGKDFTYIAYNNYEYLGYFSSTRKNVLNHMIIYVMGGPNVYSANRFSLLPPSASTSPPSAFIRPFIKF